MSSSSKPTSRRASTVPASPIRKLMPYALGAKARGVHVHHLNIGQPDIETPPQAIAALRSFEWPVVAYTQSQGTAEYVETLRTYYAGWGVALEPGQINVTTGGSEALLFTMLATLDPGDEVLVPEPFYTNYLSIARMCGVVVRPLTTRVEDGFHLPERAAVEAALTEKTRAILLCNPSNPTGTVYTKAEIDLLAELAVQRDLWLLADEVYREIVYAAQPDTYRSVLTLGALADRVVVVDSVSKRWSLCGARIGAVVSRNADVMAAVLRMSQARLSPPMLGQLVAHAAHAAGEPFILAELDAYRRRRDLVFEALEAIPGVHARRPEGAFYMVARLPVDDAERFARWLLTDFELDGETLMVAPAAGFYATDGLGTDEVRVAFVLETDALSRAMGILAAGLQAYPGRRR